jgi:anti-anti-sigma regulatory factor
MSLHVITHPWQVEDLERGPLVKITPRDLDVGTVSVLADDLFALARESGQPELSLDLTEVSVLSAVVVGKLFALDRRLREAGGRLLLCNLQPGVKELLQVESRQGGLASADGSVEEGGQADLQDCFVVFVRAATGAGGRPEEAERAVATFPSYEEAARLRDELRRSGRTCVIRFAGPTGGGD